MLAVFEHIDQNKLVPILKEVNKVLKPGGRFILTTPCTWSHKLLGVMAKLRLVSPEEFEEHKCGYNFTTITSYLKKAGFDVKKIMLGHFEMYMNNWAYADK